MFQRRKFLKINQFMKILKLKYPLHKEKLNNHFFQHPQELIQDLQ